MSVGIDLGSETVRFAYFKQTSSVRVEELDVPAVVAVGPTRILVGHEAAAELASGHENVFCLPMRKILECEVLRHPQGGERRMTSADAIAALIGPALESIKERIGTTTLRHVSFAIPEGLNAQEKKQLSIAAKACKIENFDMVPHSITSALQWAIDADIPQTSREGTNVLVANAGAGFTSTSIVNVKASSSRMLAETLFNRSWRFGGSDIDRRLRYKAPPRVPQAAEGTVVAALKAGKEALSETEQKEVEIKSVTVNLNRIDVDAAAAPLLHRLEKGCAAMKCAAEAEGITVSKVIFTGGCALMPILKDVVERTFVTTRDVSGWDHFSTNVLGAATWAYGSNTTNGKIRSLSQTPQNGIRGHRFFAVAGDMQTGQPGSDTIVPLFEDSYTLNVLPKSDTYWCVVEMQLGGEETPLTAEEVLLLFDKPGATYPDAEYDREASVKILPAREGASEELGVEFIDHGNRMVEVGPVRPGGRGAHSGMRNFVGWRVTEVNGTPLDSAAQLAGDVKSIFVVHDGKLPPHAGDIEVPIVNVVGWVKGGRTIQIDNSGVIGGVHDHLKFCPNAKEVEEQLLSDNERRADVEAGKKLAPLKMVPRATDKQPRPSGLADDSPTPSPTASPKGSVKDLLAKQRQRREELQKSGNNEDIKPLVPPPLKNTPKDDSPPALMAKGQLSPKSNQLSPKGRPPQRELLARAAAKEEDETMDYRALLKSVPKAEDAPRVTRTTSAGKEKPVSLQKRPPPVDTKPETPPKATVKEPPRSPPKAIVAPAAIADAEKKAEKLPKRTRARAVSVLQDMSNNQRKEEAEKQAEIARAARAAVAERLRDGGALGIDLGSTEFRLARYTKGRARTVPEGWIPAVVALSGQRTILAGEEAITEIAARHDNIFRYPPAHVTQAEVLAHPKGGVRLMTSGDAMTALFEKQLYRAVTPGDYADHVTISVPPSLNALEKKQVCHAANAAGFKSVDLISAPAAAAIRWGAQLTSTGVGAAGQNLLVIDAGARFTCVSAVNVRVAGGALKAEVLHSKQFRYGGLDVDKRLRHALLGEDEVDMRDDAVYAALEDAKKRVRDNKEGVQFQLRGIHKTLRQVDVTKASRPLVRRVEAAVHNILDHMKLKEKKQCDLALVLGGATCGLDQVLDILSRRLNIPIFDPEEAGGAESFVVAGAATWAGGAYQPSGGGAKIAKSVEQAHQNLTVGHQYFAVEGDERTMKPTTGTIIQLFVNGVTLHALPKVRGHWLLVEVAEGSDRPMSKDDIIGMLDKDVQAANLDAVRQADMRKECTVEFNTAWTPAQMPQLSSFAGGLPGSPKGEAPASHEISTSLGASFNMDLSGYASMDDKDVNFKDWGNGILEVESVRPGGAADKKGMRAFLGWRVTKFNDMPVAKKSDIPTVLRSVTVVRDDKVPKEAGDYETPDMRVVGAVKGGFTLQLDANGIVSEIKVPRNSEDLSLTLADDTAWRTKFECGHGRHELKRAVTRVRASSRSYSPEELERTAPDFAHYFYIAEEMLRQAQWHARGNPGRDEDFRVLAKYINTAVDSYEGKRTQQPLRDLIVKVHAAMPQSKPLRDYEAKGRDALVEIQRKLRVMEVRRMMGKPAENVCEHTNHYVRLVEKLLAPDVVGRLEKDAFSDTELGSLASFIEMVMETVEEQVKAGKVDAPALGSPAERSLAGRRASVDSIDNGFEGLTLARPPASGKPEEIKIAESVLHFKFPGSRPKASGGYKARLSLRRAMQRVANRHLASEDWLVMCPDAWHYMDLAKRAMSQPGEPEFQDHAQILANIIDKMVDALDRHAEPKEVEMFIKKQPMDLSPGIVHSDNTVPGRMNLLKAVEKFDGFFRSGIQARACVYMVPDAPHYIAFSYMCLIAKHSPLNDVEHSHLANFLHALAETHHKGGDPVRAEEKMRTLEHWLWEVVPLARPTWRAGNEVGRAMLDLQLTRLQARRIKPSELTRHCRGGRHYVAHGEEILRGERTATDDECHVLGRFIGLLMDAYEDPSFAAEIPAREELLKERVPIAASSNTIAGDATIGRDRLKKVLKHIDEDNVDQTELSIICPPAKTYIQIGRALSNPKKNPASAAGLNAASGDINLFWAQQVAHDVECYNVGKFLEGLLKEHKVYAGAPSSFDCTELEDLETWLHQVCPMTRPHGGSKLREGTGKQALKSALARCSGKGWAPSYFITPVTRDALHYFMLAEDIVRGRELASEREMFSLAKLLHAIMDAYVDRTLVRQVDLIESWLHELFLKSKPGEHSSSSPRSAAKGQLARAMRRLQARGLAASDLIGVCPNTPHYFKLGEQLLADGQGSSDNANNLAVLLHAILDQFDRPGDLNTVNEREGWLHIVYPLSVPDMPQHENTGRYQLQRVFMKLRNHGWIPEYMGKLCPYSLHYFNLGKELSSALHTPTPKEDENCRHLAAFLNVMMDTQARVNGKSATLPEGQAVVEESQAWLHSIFPESCPVSKKDDRATESQQHQPQPRSHPQPQQTLVGGPRQLDESYSPTHTAGVAYSSQQRSRSTPAGMKRVIWEPVLKEFVEVGTSKAKQYHLEEKMNQVAADIYHLKRDTSASPRGQDTAEPARSPAPLMNTLSPSRSNGGSEARVRSNFESARMRRWDFSTPNAAFLGASSPGSAGARWKRAAVEQPSKGVVLTNTSSTGAYTKLSRGMEPWDEKRSRRALSPGASTTRSRSGSVASRSVAPSSVSRARSHSVGTAAGRSTSSLTYQKPVVRPINVLSHSRMRFGAVDQADAASLVNSTVSTPQPKATPTRGKSPGSRSRKFSSP